MKNLNEILKSNKQVWFEIEKKDLQNFLQFAKNNGCKWIDGDEIDASKDKCGNHMGIGNEKELGFLSMMCWVLNSDKRVVKLKFNELKEM